MSIRQSLGLACAVFVGVSVIASPPRLPTYTAADSSPTESTSLDQGTLPQSSVPTLDVDEATQRKPVKSRPDMLDAQATGDGLLHIAGLALAVSDQVIEPAGGVLTPPAGDTGYSARLTDTQQASVYVVHVGRAEIAKGLFSNDGMPRVSPGDTVTLPDGQTATVTGAGIESKGGEAWETISPVLDDPSTVVFVTCQPQGKPVSTANLVVLAKLD